MTFSPTKVVDYETFKANQDVEVTELAWLFNMNRGHLHDARPRGGVDAVGHSHRSRRSTPTSRVFDEMAAELTA